MSEENKALVRRFYEVYSAGNGATGRNSHYEDRFRKRLNDGYVKRGDANTSQLILYPDH